MRIEFDERFLEQLKRHEGLRLSPYICPAGYRTIGYGHNLESDPLPWQMEDDAKISVSCANDILRKDVQKFGKGLDEAKPWWRRLDGPRQAVLLNMAFNLGLAGVLGFKKMWQALEAGDFDGAADEMMDSRWYGQTGKRSGELVRQMRCGEW